MLPFSYIGLNYINQSKFKKIANRYIYLLIYIMIVLFISDISLKNLLLNVAIKSIMFGSLLCMFFC